MTDPITIDQITDDDIDAARAWLNVRHNEGMSWSQLSSRIAIPASTLSMFSTGKYAGDNIRIASAVIKYRQLLVQQSASNIEAPEPPAFFATETSEQLITMLSWAQRGRLVVAALGPGLGKTRTARHYQGLYPNVFLATMSPSTAGVNTMQIEVLEAMGEKNAVGTPQKLSRRIRERAGLAGNCLLIIDEAQHLTEKALEEVRSWHDAANIGIALFGNFGVMQRLEGGTRASGFAQLFSRVSLRVVRNLPLAGDVEALASAWEIFEAPMIDFLRKVCLTPGGLRNGTMTLELASMISSANQQPLALEHLQDAWTQLSSRTVQS